MNPLRMIAVCMVVLALAPRITTAQATRSASPESSASTFSTVDVVFDTGDAAIGAYQVDLRFDSDAVHLVGVEGGAAFPEPPHYDPRALRGNRVVLAALQLDAEPTTGRVHVATLHLEHPTSVAPRLRATRIVVADRDGRAVAAELIARTAEDSE